ncbi:hypothetical protein [Portibacter lacus]|uniref:Uncharacterized protein n=1 Tax=Portibacter lacus TaxID=1099794 RepID=A0AA37SW01_9BACT|nr:hypothetical protein [Portibacter lacus]GLR19038.1 hypothetical protein GCM10007940_36540 [Portibacter lacus]
MVEIMNIIGNQDFKSAAGTKFFGGLKNEIETILIEIEQEINK